MNLTNRSGFYFAKLLVLATILKLSFTAEVINGEYPREILALDENSQDLPVIILSDNFYEKRNNMNTFKNLMLNKDSNYVAPDIPDKEEQVFSKFPRTHAGSGKRAQVLSLGSGNRRYGTINYRQQPSNYGSARQTA